MILSIIGYLTFSMVSTNIAPTLRTMASPAIEPLVWTRVCLSFAEPTSTTPWRESLVSLALS